MNLIAIPISAIQWKNDACKLLKYSNFPKFPKFPIVSYNYSKGREIWEVTREVRKYTNKVYIYMYNILYISYLDSKTFFHWHVEKSGNIRKPSFSPSIHQDSHP